MTSPQLPNYLRSNRKRLALLQEDVALLLGTETGQTVCRHERFSREPSLATALAYEAIYQKPVRELFAGLYQKIEQEVASRAKTFANRPTGPKTGGQGAHRRRSTGEIGVRAPDKLRNA